ncbi:tyrosine-type recombinase/integrase [Cupriavidus taiwanensis]|uniref:tyrosine-type recombinase/integrase n=1 Tax=Cupriavidus taiwanensis TaxID=164546 RepID=UPI000E10E60E|nr:site-specific integrase [Cupriavidus taiwanensis]SPA50636.1 putative Site-specific recombinase, phage integrase family [Cupriavidus taiwanensis]
MSIYKRPDGAGYWYEFVLKGKRFRGATGTDNPSEARQIEAQKRLEAAEAMRRDALGVKRLTLYVVAQMWLTETQKVLSDTRNNASRVRKLFGTELVWTKIKGHPDGGEWTPRENARYGLSKTMMVDELTQADLLSLKRERLTEGNSPSTINREMALVQSLLGFAEAMGVSMPARAIIWDAKRNRAASAKMPKTPPKTRWLTLAEEEKLLGYMRERVRPEDVAWIDALELSTLLLDTGARYSEIAGMRWDQVSLEGDVMIDLQRSKTRNRSWLKVTKRAAAILRRRKPATPGTYVFPAQVAVARGTMAYSREDEPRGHATKKIQQAIEECGLNENAAQVGRVTPHTFRDTYASRLAQAGISLAEIANILGHSSTQMTEKYAHLCPDRAGEKAADVLDRLMHAE